MSLSAEAVKRLMIASTSKDLGNELATAVNKGDAAGSQGAFLCPALIVATATSQTTDFGALRVGDKVLHVPAAAGNADFQAIAVAGDLGEAAVIGDLYVVLRAISLPAASAASF